MVLNLAHLSEYMMMNWIIWIMSHVIITINVNPGPALHPPGCSSSNPGSEWINLRVKREAQVSGCAGNTRPVLKLPQHYPQHAAPFISSRGGHNPHLLYITSSGSAVLSSHVWCGLLGKELTFILILFRLFRVRVLDSTVWRLCQDDVL